MLERFFSFLFGLFVGSFLNVCIWRIPAGEQVIQGRSHCRSCGKTIPWVDNVPLVSFCLLKGKCRFCGNRISLLYPAVELATGLLFLGLVHTFGGTIQTLIYAALGASLILISGVDFREMLIPSEVTRPGLIFGSAVSFLFPALHGTTNHWQGLGLSLLGIGAGAGLVLGMGAFGKLLFRRKLRSIGEEEAVGQGDVWLMAMVGSLIGWKQVLLVTFLFAPLLGTVSWLVLKSRYPKGLLPYGPFLSIGTLIALFWGDRIINWYINLF